jgi:NAD-dependent SIR2 family protein deacetylase
VTIDVDADTIRARPPLPRCPHCGGLARPNVLMFGDGQWVPARYEEQEDHYRRWLAGIDPKQLVVIELGAGTAVPTVRWECEGRGGQLIRVNPRDADAPLGSIVLAVGALQAIQEIDRILLMSAREDRPSR